MNMKHDRINQISAIILGLASAVIILTTLIIIISNNTHSAYIKQCGIHKAEAIKTDVDNIKFPFINPDKQEIIYWNEKENKIYTADLETLKAKPQSQINNLLLLEQPESIRWSPKGDEFVFASKNRQSLVNMQKNAIQDLRLDQNWELDIERLAWSNDGKKIAFQTQPSSDLKSQIYAYYSESDQFKLLSTADLSDYDYTYGLVSLKWLPDNSTVIYSPEITDIDVPWWWILSNGTPAERKAETVWINAEIQSISPSHTHFLIVLSNSELLNSDQSDYLFTYGIVNIENGEIQKTNIEAYSSLCLWKDNESLICLTEKTTTQEKKIIIIGSFSLEDSKYTQQAFSSSIDLDNISAISYDKNNNTLYIVTYLEKELLIIPLDSNKETRQNCLITL